MLCKQETISVKSLSDELNNLRGDGFLEVLLILMLKSKDGLLAQLAEQQKLWTLGTPARILHGYAELKAQLLQWKQRIKFKIHGIMNALTITLQANQKGKTGLAKFHRLYVTFLTLLSCH